MRTAQQLSIALPIEMADAIKGKAVLLGPSIQLDCTKGIITMAGVFGKDPNMKKNTHAELERVNLERKRRLAEAAAKFTQKKPVVPDAQSGAK